MLRINWRKVKIENIGMYRDGGTIYFTLENSKADGYYRLYSEWLYGHRKLERNGEALAEGGNDEAKVLSELEYWLKVSVNTSIKKRLDKLANVEWVGLDDDLREVIPYYRVKTVIDVLQKRKI